MSSLRGNWAEDYPESADRIGSLARRSAHAVLGTLPLDAVRRLRDSGLPSQVRARQQRLRSLSDDELRAEARVVGGELRRRRHGALRRHRRESGHEHETTAFALVREAARRALGMELAEGQILAGAALLRGQVVEIPTGEGKTLATALAASTQAMAGVPMHVIAANDYLAARDAAAMQPLYALLGLGVGSVVAGAAPDERRSAYARDVTYSSAREVAFDYLRDRSALGASCVPQRQFERLFGRRATRPLPVLRGLRSAIVDDADCVLIDEARTPLVLSRPSAGDSGYDVAVTGEPETIARISFQRFFRRYLRLAGITGAAREARGELWRVYGLRVAAIRPEQPSRRVCLAERVFATADEKWRYVVARAGALRATGRPVLIGAAHPAAAGHLSDMLAAAGLPHGRLDGSEHDAEAEVVAGAGQPGRITVATGTAGRGTDIPLGEGVSAAGGLHVILAERHDAARIDRHLIERSGPQGRPGSYELVLSLEDSLLERAGGALATPLIRRVASWSLCFGSAPAAALLRASQRRTQRAAEDFRFRMLRADHRTDDRLAFAGGRK